MSYSIDVLETKKEEIKIYLEKVRILKPENKTDEIYINDTIAVFKDKIDNLDKNISILKRINYENSKI